MEETCAKMENNEDLELENIDSLISSITKIRVYFWIEGQDYDCENDASGGNIALNLQISRVATGG